MSQTCAINACHRTSRALCYCCQQNVCIIHLNEHNDRLNNRLNPLVDLINTLDTRIRTIDSSKTFANYRGKLEQWRVESHQKIEDLFERKCQELDQILIEKINEQREKITQIQSRITELIREQQVTQQDIYELSSTVDHLDRVMNNLDENFIEIRIHPLTVDNQMINIRGINEEDYDLARLSPVYKLINLPDGSFGTMASNQHYLLIHQAPNLCLIGRDLTIFKRIAWRNGLIHDMCWSGTLDRFIIVDQKSLFVLDGNTMSIDKLKITEKKKWMSCACSEKFLFLSNNEWGSAITKIALDPSKKLGKQWQSPSVCGKDEFIDIIAYNNNRLAMIIRNHLKTSIRIELRSSESLDRIWSLPLDLVWNPNKPFHCCSFLADDWLISDYETGRLLHVTKSGGMKSVMPYNTIPYCTTHFGSNILAISTKNAINFHELNCAKSYTIFVL